MNPNPFLGSLTQWFPQDHPPQLTQSSPDRPECKISSRQRQTASHWKSQKSSQAKSTKTKSPLYRTKELSDKENKLFGYVLRPNTKNNDLMIGFINVQYLPKTVRGGNYFDLTHLMMGMKFDHIGLAGKSRHWPYLQDEDRTPQILCVHFMSQHLDAITTCNEYEIFLGSFQYGENVSLSNRKYIGINTSSSREQSGMGRWTW